MCGERRTQKKNVSSQMGFEPSTVRTLVEFGIFTPKVQIFHVLYTGHIAVVGVHFI